MAAKRTDSELSPQAQAMRAKREHYALYLDDGYNRALDERKGPINPYGYKHATAAGYEIAKCKCPGCKEVGRQNNERQGVKRLTDRLVAHRAAARSVLATHVPAAADDARLLDEGAELVVSKRQVTSARRGKVDYNRELLRYALRDDWFVDLDEDCLDAVVDALMRELRS
jgi:hypothetical protein